MFVKKSVYKHIILFNLLVDDIVSTFFHRIVLKTNLKPVHNFERHIFVT